MCKSVKVADLLKPYLSDLSVLSIYTCNLFLPEITVKLFSLLELQQNSHDDTDIEILTARGKNPPEIINKPLQIK